MTVVVTLRCDVGIVDVVVVVRLAMWLFDVVECYCFLINIIVVPPGPRPLALPRAALNFLHFFVPGCCKTLTPRGGSLWL